MEGVTIVRGQEEGPRVLVAVAVHGNEPVGLLWRDRFVEAVRAGEVVLRGEVVVLHGNPAATEAGERHLGFDLNRAFRSEILGEHPPRSPDVARAREIAQWLAGERFDLIVDLHSVSRGDAVMVVAPAAQAPWREERERWRGCAPLLFLYREGDVPGLLLDYAARVTGARRRYAFECGNHTAAVGADRAWAFVRTLLQEGGAWEGGEQEGGAPRGVPPRVYEVVERVDASEDFQWVLPVERLRSEEVLEAGEVYARRGDELLRAPERLVLMMPALTFAPHDEAIAFLMRELASGRGGPTRYGKG